MSRKVKFIVVNKSNIQYEIYIEFILSIISSINMSKRIIKKSNILKDERLYLINIKNCRKIYFVG